MDPWKATQVVRVLKSTYGLDVPLIAAERALEAVGAGVDDIAEQSGGGTDVGGATVEGAVSWYLSRARSAGAPLPGQGPGDGFEPPISPIPGIAGTEAEIVGGRPHAAPGGLYPPMQLPQESSFPSSHRALSQPLQSEPASSELVNSFMELLLDGRQAQPGAIQLPVSGYPAVYGGEHPSLAPAAALFSPSSPRVRLQPCPPVTSLAPGGPSSAGVSGAASPRQYAAPPPRFCVGCNEHLDHLGSQELPCGHGVCAGCASTFCARFPDSPITCPVCQRPIAQAPSRPAAAGLAGASGVSSSMPLGALSRRSGGALSALDAELEAMDRRTLQLLVQWMATSAGAFLQRVVVDLIEQPPLRPHPVDVAALRRLLSCLPGSPNGRAGSPVTASAPSSQRRGSPKAEVASGIVGCSVSGPPGPASPLTLGPAAMPPPLSPPAVPSGVPGATGGSASPGETGPGAPQPRGSPHSPASSLLPPPASSPQAGPTAADDGDRGARSPSPRAGAQQALEQVQQGGGAGEFALGLGVLVGSAGGQSLELGHSYPSLDGRGRVRWCAVCGVAAPSAPAWTQHAASASHTEAVRRQLATGPGSGGGARGGKVGAGGASGAAGAAAIDAAGSGRKRGGGSSSTRSGRRGGAGNGKDGGAGSGTGGSNGGGGTGGSWGDLAPSAGLGPMAGLGAAAVAAGGWAGEVWEVPRFAEFERGGGGSPGAGAGGSSVGGSGAGDAGDGATGGVGGAADDDGGWMKVGGKTVVVSGGGGLDARGGAGGGVGAGSGLPSVTQWYTDGVVFGCTNGSYDETMRRLLFGLRRSFLSVVTGISRRTALFLFNHSSRQMFGLFQGRGPGDETIEPHAWATTYKPPAKHDRLRERPTGGATTPLAAQIRVQYVHEFPRLDEAKILDVLPINPGTGKFNVKLNRVPTRLLIQRMLDVEDAMRQAAAAGGGAGVGSGGE